MDGSNSVSMVRLNLDTTVAKDIMFSRDCPYFVSKGNLLKVVVWSQSWCPLFVNALSSSPESQDWVFWKIFLFLMELMVENVSRKIQFGLMILVVGAYFMVWVMVSPTCSDRDTVRVLYVDGG